MCYNKKGSFSEGRSGMEEKMVRKEIDKHVNKEIDEHVTKSTQTLYKIITTCGNRKN